MELITWNVQWCCGLDGRVDPDRILETALALADFDVLCLQEVADNYPALRGDAGQDQAARLAAALPGFTACYGPAVDEWRADTGRSRFGNLILSRLPVLETWTLRLPWPAEPGVPSMPRACTVAVLASPTLGPVRVMTTHLEYHGQAGRLAQARALQAHHQEACDLALTPPPGRDDGTPFRPRAHTAQAVLCGDFNAGAHGPEYALLTGAQRAPWLDAWPMAEAHKPVHGEALPAQPPTFKVFDQTYGPTPLACDFIFVSEALAPRVSRVAVDSQTRASDHQPVLLELN